MIIFEYLKFQLSSSPRCLLCCPTASPSFSEVKNTQKETSRPRTVRFWFLQQRRFVATTKVFDLWWKECLWLREQFIRRFNATTRATCRQKTVFPARDWAKTVFSAWAVNQSRQTRKKNDIQKWSFMAKRTCLTSTLNASTPKPAFTEVKHTAPEHFQRFSTYGKPKLKIFYL